MKKAKQIVQELLESGFQGTQHEICAKAAEAGHKVTQATVSRYLKDLKAIKQGDIWSVATERPVLKVKILGEHGRMPTQAYEGDSGWDVYAAHDARLYPGEIAKIGTQIALEPQPGFEVVLRPRSGLSSKGVIMANAPGTIDNGYRGEISVLLCSLKVETRIARGNKIAQLVLQRVCLPRLELAEELSPSERGSGGFGSSGV